MATSDAHVAAMKTGPRNLITDVTGLRVGNADEARVKTGVSVEGAGAELTAGYAFDVPVRFDTDSLIINLAAFEAGEIPDIPIVEIRP